MPLIADSIRLVVVGRLDVVGADALEDVAEQVELAIGVGGGRIGSPAGEDVSLGQRDGGRARRTRHRRGEVRLCESSANLFIR